MRWTKFSSNVWLFDELLTCFFSTNQIRGNCNIYDLLLTWGFLDQSDSRKLVILMLSTELFSQLERSLPAPVGRAEPDGAPGGEDAGRCWGGARRTALHTDLRVRVLKSLRAGFPFASGDARGTGAGEGTGTPFPSPARVPRAANGEPACRLTQ